MVRLVLRGRAATATPMGGLGVTDVSAGAVSGPQPSRLRGAWRWARSVPEARLGTWAHWLVLASAGAYVLVVDRHAWFNGDEWAPIVDRKLLGGGGTLSLLPPHNEHFVAVPFLLYRITFTFFAARTYLPYIVLIVVSHLLVVELLWLVLRRTKINVWVAVVATAGFAFLGVGWENILTPFQMAFDLALAAGLGALLLVPESGPWSRRDLGASGVLVVGIACSGIGVPMVAVVAFLQLLRRGWRIALGTLAAPAVVWLAWYAKYHAQARAVGTEPVRTALQRLPALVWIGLTNPISTTLELSGIGAVVIVLIGLWAVRRAQPGADPWPIVLAAAGGAVVALALTGIERAQYGPSEAATSRYAYVTLALLLPLAALAVDAVLRSSRLRLVALAGGLIFLLLVGTSQLKQHADSNAEVDQQTKSLVLATAQLARTTTHFLFPGPIPVDASILTAARIHRLDANGDLPAAPVTQYDTLWALEYLQLVAGPSLQLNGGTSDPPVIAVSGLTVTTAAQPTCVGLDATSDHPTVQLRLAGPTSVVFDPQRSGDLSFQLAVSGAVGPARLFTLAGGQPVALNIDAPRTDAIIEVPPQGVTELCEVTGPAAGITGR